MSAMCREHKVSITAPRKATNMSGVLDRAKWRHSPLQVLLYVCRLMDPSNGS